MLSVNIITMFEMANIVRIDMKVVFRSKRENNDGVISPKIAIVNVNELTYKPDRAMVVLKYCEICDIIPIILNGVLIPSAEIIKI